MNVMTCREMEALLRDIVLESQPTELKTTEPQAMPSDAAAHLEACPRCSALLERERRLTANLAALAGSLGNCEVPAATEARLLAAFREHARDRRNRRPVFQLPARRPAVWAAGAAAIIVVSLGILVREWQPSATPVEPPATPAAPLAASQPAGPAAIPGVVRPGGPQTNPSATDTARHIARRAADPSQSADARPVEKPATASFPVAEQAALQRPPQVASDFVPLFYGGDPFLMEAGQVWRVEMPRGALQSVGMPVAEESRAGRVQVDILLGEDGIARAIRLVQ